MIVLDESHYIKKMERGRYADAVLRISPNAIRRVILTGTPMPNDTRDLWTQMTFLWPNEEILGNTRQYAARQDNIDAIREDINPFFIRINKRTLNLPRTNFEYPIVPMAERQSEIYRAIAARTLLELGYARSDRAELRRWRRARMIRLLQQVLLLLLVFLFLLKSLIYSFCFSKFKFKFFVFSTLVFFIT